MMTKSRLLITTPNYLHAEPAIEAAKAGKHVISENLLPEMLLKQNNEGCG